MKSFLILSLLILSGSHISNASDDITNNKLNQVRLNQLELINNECKFCNIIVKTIDNEIKNGNKSINAIENIVEDLCHVTWGPSSQECEFVVKHIQYIINNLEKGMSINNICQKLKFCNNLFIDNNSTCKICTVIVNIIDKELKLGNKTISDIESIVQDICHIIGGPQGQECLLIVNNLQKIINLLMKGLTSLQVCNDLHLCNNTYLIN